MDQRNELIEVQQETAPRGEGRGARDAWWRQRYAIILAAILFACGAGAIYYFWGVERASAVRYTTAPVTTGPVERSVSTSGTVNPVLTVIVGSYISGVITGQYCDYNTQVKKGQLCAQIDPRPYQTVVDQAKAELATAKAQLNKDLANLAYQQSLYERNAGLLKRGIVSQETLDSLKSAYEQAKAQIELDKASIEQHSAALNAAQVNLEYTHIRSPVSGTVVSRNITIGQTVAASFQTPTLFLIAADLTEMQVDANVSESDIGEVREKARAAFTVEAFPGRPFEGHVVQVRQAPQTVQNVVTYDVVIGVNNDDLLLKPGMTATTRIIVAERQNALRVPDQALRYSAGGTEGAPSAGRAPAGNQGATPSRVWVLRDGKPTPVAVTLGLDDDTYSEVIAGDLKAGDQVITGEQRESRAASMPSAGPRFFGR